MTNSNKNIKDLIREKSNDNNGLIAMAGGVGCPVQVLDGLSRCDDRSAIRFGATLAVIEELVRNIKLLPEDLQYAAVTALESEFVKTFCEGT